MSDELLRLSKLVQELSIQRGEVITQLSEVDHNLAIAVEYRNKERRRLSAKEGATSKAKSEKSTAQDSRGEILSIGNIVQTVTQGKYFEREEMVLSIKGDKVTIQYLKGKKKTWRLSRSLRKISNTV